jgi:DNA-binding transcriptional MerR regulator
VAGWRAYGPDQIAQAAEIVGLRMLGLSLVQIERLLRGESKGLAPVLAEHQATLEGRIEALVRTVGKLRDIQADLVHGQSPTAGELAHLLKPAAEMNIAVELPWPWAGEQIVLECRSLNYITGPLGSGKTRLALQLAETLPNAAFLGLERSSDEGAVAKARLDADPSLRSRVDRILAWLSDEGAMRSNALIALIVGVECAGPDCADCRFGRARTGRSHTRGCEYLSAQSSRRRQRSDLPADAVIHHFGPHCGRCR